MKVELVVSEPISLGMKPYAVGEVVREEHVREAETFHPNHFRRRYISELVANQNLTEEQG